MSMQALKFIYYVAASLDGFIADSKGGLDWLAPYHSGDFGMMAFMQEIDCCVMGRKTYEQCRSFGAPPGPKIPYIVLSQSVADVQEPFERFENIDALLATMRKRELSTAWLMGGGQTATSFVDANLLTELRLFTIPVILGAGVPLFAPNDSGIRKLELTSTKSYENGVVERRYAFGK